MEYAEPKVEDVLAELQPKLTEWENEPSVRDLKEDLTEASGSHNSQVAKINTWLDNLNVTGRARIKKKKGRSTIVPKLIRKQAEWRYAALSEPFLSNDTLFKTAPVSWEDKKAAIQNGIVLNNQFNTKINKVKFIDEYVRTAVDEGTVIVRVGWDFQEEEQDVEVPLVQMQPVINPEQAQMMLQQGIPPIEEVVVGTKMERQMVTIRNQPTVEVCNYNNVIIDPTCNGDIDQANFVIFSFETSLSDLEKSGKYTNLNKINLDRSSPLSEPDHEDTSDSFQFKDKPRKRFVAYEYWGFWDIDGSGITKPIVATWVGDTMIRMEENPFPDGELPFVVVQYLPKRFSVYGEPDGELLEDNQKILGAVTRGMIDLMGRSANSQMAIRQDALDVTNRRKYEAGMDYEFGAHIDPRVAFYQHSFPEIPNSAQFMVQFQNMEAEALTGVKAFHGGLSGDSLGNTATGIRGALDAASKRELGILRRLADGMVKIGRKIIGMNAEFLSEEEIIRVTNDEFIAIKRDDLQGNLDIKLDIATAEAENAKAQELAFMLQTMGNSMPPDMSQMILADIARLRKMPDLAKRIEEYQPQPDPMEEQIKQLEIAERQARIQKLQSETTENQTDAQLNQAKTREIHGKADLQDLDFVEEESGVKHERDLQKQGEQARANLERDRMNNEEKLRADVIRDQMKPKPTGNAGGQ